MTKKPRTPKPFQKGEWVIIRSDLEEGSKDGGVIVACEMLKHRGKLARVTHVDNSDNTIHLDVDDTEWWWDETHVIRASTEPDDNEQTFKCEHCKTNELTLRYINRFGLLCPKCRKSTNQSTHPTNQSTHPVNLTTKKEL